MAGWSQDWAWVQDRLSAGGRVCSYDRAGYGWSDAASSPRLGLDAVADLRRALRAAGEAPPGCSPAIPWVDCWLACTPASIRPMWPDSP